MPALAIALEPCPEETLLASLAMGDGDGGGAACLDHADPADHDDDVSWFDGDRRARLGRSCSALADTDLSRAAGGRAGFAKLNSAAGRCGGPANPEAPIFLKLNIA